MATQTKRTQPTTVAPPTARSLPSALEIIRGLNEVARSLEPFHAGTSSLEQVAIGVERLLRPQGVAILTRLRPGEYAFRHTSGVLHEWTGYTLSGEPCALLDEVLRRDEVILFHHRQRTPWAREFLFAAGMQGGALAPVRAHGEPIGALLLNHAVPFRFGAEHAAGLQSLATMAGVAILEDAQRSKLEDLFMSVIVSLTMAIEAKDPYTEGHSVRVAAYSEAMGKRLGLPPVKLDVIHRSCLLHDIGKIAVDEGILHKGERLDTREKEKMDLHPLIGESILRPIELLRPLLPGVRSHHEHFDGTGYPDGLKGEAIPIEARIMAVADAFDAMTSDRPYRKALTEQAALDELRRNAGTHFDPRVVAAFEDMFPAVRRTLEHLRPGPENVRGSR
ncbi:MAG TPA: HD domain-containing phosphohydrolase [Acidobacteriota bacterium]|nr:HD domain-containing phosphohydrolase [Acidobacteriota bacterium]